MVRKGYLIMFTKKSIVYILCIVVFALAGCKAEGEISNGSSVEWSSPKTVIEAAVKKLEEAKSLEYKQMKQKATVLDNETYYGATIITSQEIFSPRCRYWIQEEIYPDYEENVNPGTRLEFYVRNDGYTLERGTKSEDKWTAQLPLSGEPVRKNLEFDQAIWQSYWFILNENIVSFTGQPVEGSINDTQTVSYFGSISSESLKEAFKKYYESQSIWQDLADPHKMLAGVPAMTLIDKPIPIILRFNKDAAALIQIDLDTTEVEKDIVETHLLYDIVGIDTLKQIKVPEGLNSEVQ